MSPEDKPSKTEDRHETLRTIGRQGSRVSLAILLSRLFGFLRDMLIAERFGTGAMADLFYVAYRIPNMLRELFAEGALSSAFIPTLTRTLDREGRDEAERLYTGVFLLLTLILLPVILGGMLFAPEILSLLAPGWSIDPDRKDLGSLMIRIMFPFLYFISLSALIMGVYNAQKRFFLPAASPIAFSLALIAATLLPDSLLPGPPILRLALGVLAGGLSQWGVQWLLLGETAFISWMYFLWPRPGRTPGSGGSWHVFFPRWGDSGSPRGSSDRHPVRILSCHRNDRRPLLRHAL
ncbi:MAG: hypothetical protein D084_Lepto4C00542G0001, partial [Leptospirillum sp. Group IV 'UBA BS']